MSDVDTATQHIIETDFVTDSTSQRVIVLWCPVATEVVLVAMKDWRTPCVCGEAI
jgi:hypothetical protein